jgi:hypothetical protein
MSVTVPEGPAARKRLFELARSRPDRVTVTADMESFALHCFRVFAQAQSDIASGADVAAVERSVVAQVVELKTRAVAAMRAAYGEILDREIAAARARGADDLVSALSAEREPVFFVEATDDALTLSLHPALAPHADRIKAALSESDD